MKRILSIIIVAMLLVSMFSVASASDISTYASKVIAETTVAIRLNSGKVYGMGNIKAVDTADKLGISAMALYEENDSGGWTKVASASSKYGYNTDDYSHTISVTGTAGREYKLIVNFYGKIGTVSDTHTQVIYSTYE